MEKQFPRPPSDEAHGSPQTAGHRGKDKKHANGIHLKDQTQTVSAVEFAALKSAFASRGHSLFRMKTGRDKKPLFMVSNWGMSRTFESIEEVRNFLARVGGN